MKNSRLPDVGGGLHGRVGGRVVVKYTFNRNTMFLLKIYYNGTNEILVNSETTNTNSVRDKRIHVNRTTEGDLQYIRVVLKNLSLKVGP